MALPCAGAASAWRWRRRSCCSRSTRPPRPGGARPWRDPLRPAAGSLPVSLHRLQLRQARPPRDRHDHAQRALRPAGGGRHRRGRVSRRPSRPRAGGGRGAASRVAAQGRRRQRAPARARRRARGGRRRIVQPQRLAGRSLRYAGAGGAPRDRALRDHLQQAVLSPLRLRRGGPLVKRSDALIASLLALATVAWLLAVEGKQGIGRDEAQYFRAGERYWGWFESGWHNLRAGRLRATFTRPGIDAYWGDNHEHPPVMKTLYRIS